MIHHKERKSSTNVFPKIQIVTPETIISTLRGICEQRFHAYSVAPASKNITSKLQTIQMIRIGLAYAEARMHWREKLRYCLKLKPYFEVIATRSSAKAHANYMQKLNNITSSCKEAILRRAEA